MIDLNGNLLQKIISDKNDNAQPIMSRDGSKIAYMVSNLYENGSEIWVLETRTGKKQKIVESNHMDVNLDFSPDGKKLIFKRAEIYRKFHMGGYVWSDWNLYETDLISMDKKQLTNQRNYVIYGANYLNGTDIFFNADSANKSFKSYIWQVSRGKEPVRIQAENAIELGYSPRTSMLMYWKDTEARPRFRMVFFGLKENVSEEIYATSNFLVSSSISQNGDKILMMFEDLRSRGDFSLYVLDMKVKTPKKIEIQK